MGWWLQSAIHCETDLSSLRAISALAALTQALLASMTAGSLGGSTTERPVETSAAAREMATIMDASDSRPAIFFTAAGIRAQRNGCTNVGRSAPQFAAVSRRPKSHSLAR